MTFIHFVFKFFFKRIKFFIKFSSALAAKIFSTDCSKTFFSFARLIPRADSTLALPLISISLTPKDQPHRNNVDQLRHHNKTNCMTRTSWPLSMDIFFIALAIFSLAILIKPSATGKCSSFAVVDYLSSTISFLNSALTICRV